MVTIKNASELSRFVQAGKVVTTSEHVLVVSRKLGKVFCHTCPDLSGVSVSLAKQLAAPYTGRFPVRVNL